MKWMYANKNMRFMVKKIIKVDKNKINLVTFLK